MTARSEFFNLTCPGSGATNILFTAVNRPLVLPSVLPHGVPGWWELADMTKAPRSGPASSPPRRCAAPKVPGYDKETIRVASGSTHGPSTGPLAQ